MDTLLIVLLLVLLVAFDLAALRWGYDSRDGFRDSFRDGLRPIDPGR
jgi:hypothetical protein